MENPRILGPREPLLSTATCSRDRIEIKAKVTDPNHTESSGRARTLCWVCGAWRTCWWRCPGGLNSGERMGLHRALVVIRSGAWLSSGRPECGRVLRTNPWGRSLARARENNHTAEQCASMEYTALCFCPVPPYKVGIAFPILRMSERGSERLGNLPKVTEQK